MKSLAKSRAGLSRNVIPSPFSRSSSSSAEGTSSKTYSKLTLNDLEPVTREMYNNLLKGNRAALAKSITLVESTLPANISESRKLMTLVTQHAREQPKAFRIGLSGPPGAGKSTFIEAFGTMLTKKGNKVAVLAVDPSSARRGGSLLGDQTRMTELSRDPNAYIRPSPNRGHLGGVARTTNEAIELCEACGYNIVLVETVGVGQSEHMVSDMVDALCLVLAPGAGDELQGIKRGIVEQCDLVLVNKCDGDMKPAARRTKADYLSALKFMMPKSKNWKTEVLMMSSTTGEGLEMVYDVLEEFNETMTECGELDERRNLQHKKWLWNYINHRLLEVIF